VYAYLQATRNDQPLPLLAPQFLLPLAAVVLVCGLATALPLRIGLPRMEEFEIWPLSQPHGHERPAPDLPADRLAPSNLHGLGGPVR
jgi:hypothetical protein